MINVADARVLDERVEGLNCTFRISVDGERIRLAVKARLQEISRTARVPGFRLGRAPLALLSNRFGDRLRIAAVDHLALDVARMLIAERNLEPASRPRISIDNDCTSGPVTFTLFLEVMPRVVLTSIDGFRLQRLRVPNADSALIEQANDYLHRQLFDKLLAGHDFSVPQDLVENEYKEIRHGCEMQIGEAVDEKLDLELRLLAERRIRLAILLTEIGRRHGIHVQRREVEALIDRQIEREPDHEAEIINYYLDHPTTLAELQAPIFEERVVKFLLDRCEIEVVEVNEEQFQKTLEQL